MRSVLTLAKNNYKQVLFGVISLILLAIISYSGISTITNNKLSQPEINAINSSLSGQIILDNPLFAPFKIPVYFLIKTGLATITSLRMVSATYGIILAIFFYLFIKRWFSSKIAWLATAMLSTSGLFLNYSRLAVPYILLPFSLLLLLWSSWWIYQSKNIKAKLIVALCLVIACFYIPGLIWFAVILVLLQKPHFKNMFAGISKTYTYISALLVLLMIMPLIIAFYKDSSVLIQWLALPSQFDIKNLINNFLLIPISFVIRSESNPVFNLGRLPYLDIITICLAVLGTYAFAIRFKLMRTEALVFSILIALLLLSFENQVQVNILLPVIYTVVASGIMFLLQQWLSVFPKNPIARVVGIALIACTLSLSIYYNTVRYFLAWGNNPISQQAFQIKLPEKF